MSFALSIPAGPLNFSSVGLGTATHIAAERFRHSAAIDATHVPFKGGGEAMSEVISGLKLDS